MLDKTKDTTSLDPEPSETEGMRDTELPEHDLVSDIRSAFTAALPIMLGYLFLGIPCGILCQAVGMDAVMVFVMSIILYSGAGQYMIPNMLLAQSPLLMIIASVSLVNSRQMLYSASLSRFCKGADRFLSFFFAYTVTDESFGVNLAKFYDGNWTVREATWVNWFSRITWALANVVGVLIGSILSLPTALASFAMTAIFLCLLFSQKGTVGNIAAAGIAAVGVFVCKCVGLSGPAIFVGACLGVAAGVVASRFRNEEAA